SASANFERARNVAAESSTRDDAPDEPPVEVLALFLIEVSVDLPKAKRAELDRIIDGVKLPAGLTWKVIRPRRDFRRAARAHLIGAAIEKRNLMVEAKEGQ